LIAASRAGAFALASAVLFLAVALTLQASSESPSAVSAGPKLVASTSVPLPPLEKFEPGIRPLEGELRLAFLELEAGNPGPLHMGMDGLKPIVASLDRYLRAISDGALNVSTNFAILSREVSTSRLGEENASNIVAAELSPALERHESEKSIEGALLIAWVNTVGLNSTLDLGPSPMHPTRLALVGQEYLVDPEASALAIAFSLIEAVTGLESCARYAEQWYPFVNWRPGDLLGPGMEGEPCGAVKVELGWRRYLTLNPGPGETIKLQVNNTEIKDAKIVRIPLGFVLDVGHSDNPQLPHHPSENWILVKSLVIELRASRIFDLDGTPRWGVVRDPGLRLYYDYEALSGIWYSHRAPFTEFYVLNTSHGGLTPPYFSLQNRSSVPGYDRFRITNYTSPGLRLEVLGEDWPQMTFRSSTLALTVNDSSPPLNYTLVGNFYDVEQRALVVQVIAGMIDGHKVGYRLGGPLEFKQSFLRDDSLIDYYVVFGRSFTGDENGFARNLLTSAFGVDESHLSYAYGVLNSSERMLEFSLNNNVDTRHVSVPNYVNLPDLEISSSDLHVSEDRPREGESIVFRAIIHNRGGADAENVSVYVTEDRGVVGNGSSVTMRCVLPRIEAKSSAVVEGTWNTAGRLGRNYLVLHVDPGESFAEIDESNNEASIELNVLIPSSVTISVDPMFLTKDRHVTVSGYVSPARNRTQVRVWYERPDGSRFFEIVYTATDGSFVDTVAPDMAGRWVVNASCGGDQEHSGAVSKPVQFLVGESTTTSTTTRTSVTLTEHPTTVTSTTEETQTSSRPLSMEALIVLAIVIIGTMVGAMLGFSRVLHS